MTCMEEREIHGVISGRVGLYAYMTVNDLIDRPGCFFDFGGS